MGPLNYFFSFVGTDSQCEDEIMVRRSTVYAAQPGEPLCISCPAKLCRKPSRPLAISWYMLGNDLKQNIVVPTSHITTVSDH